MKVDHLHERQLLRALRPDQGLPKGATVERNKSREQADTVNLSREGRLLLSFKQGLEALGEEIQELPDTRKEKLALARERLASGFYDTAAARDTIAERLLESFRG